MSIKSWRESITPTTTLGEQLVLMQDEIDELRSMLTEQDAVRKKAWKDAAQLCHEMYMEQEYREKPDDYADDYADGIAEGMGRCAKELAQKAKGQP